ncbi:LLM class flavin-dependent oxidoreductase [Williamsia sterculiae]|nr:LLM class flavin-dependent oxidoreductase [Williamsia sterculiae]
MSEQLHVAIALDGAGWHPAAWRADSARPGELLSARYWVDQVRVAERGLVDLVTIEDAFSLWRRDAQPRTDRAVGHLDAELIAARVAPAVPNIGLVPTVVATHTEPFHVSKAIATLDHVSHGRAGVRIRISHRADEAPLLGRRTGDDPVADLLDEAADHIEVIRGLWDSWEDDAEIRDAATGRFVDRDKLHYIDFEGRFFSVRGPSITPRPPQGQPVVAALAHHDDVYRLVGRSADLGFVTPGDPDQARHAFDTVQAARQEFGRDDEPVHVFADLTVFLGPTRDAAVARKARLDDLAGEEFVDDAPSVVGTAADVADRIVELANPTTGLTGVRLRPGSIPDDLRSIADDLVPELQRRGVFRTEYREESLRSRLGLDRPTNRYADRRSKAGVR